MAYEIAGDKELQKKADDLLTALCLVTRKKANEPKSLDSITKKADQYTKNTTYEKEWNDEPHKIQYAIQRLVDGGLAGWSTKTSVYLTERGVNDCGHVVLA